MPEDPNRYGEVTGSLTGNGSILEYKGGELDWCESYVRFHCLKDGSLAVKWRVKSLLDDVAFDEGFSVKYGKYPENLYSPCLRPRVFARGCLS